LQFPGLIKNQEKENDLSKTRAEMLSRVHEIRPRGKNGEKETWSHVAHVLPDKTKNELNFNPPHSD
jgi:hypothetical protein